MPRRVSVRHKGASFDVLYRIERAERQMAVGGQAPEDYEEEHVHEVYQQIASHFSSTRYKPWPIVHDFLLSQSPCSVGLDIGCGNGKYLTVNRDIFIIGSDRSSKLASI